MYINIYQARDTRGPLRNNIAFNKDCNTSFKMVEYNCKRCGYKTDHLSKYKLHLQRATICPATVADIALEELLQDYESQTTKSKEYKCDYCIKTFTTPQAKYQHKQHCKNKSTGDMLSVQNQLKELNTKLEEVKCDNEKLKNETSKLKEQLLQSQIKKDKIYYQTILEELLQGTHKTLPVGITDITTDAFHSEIKQWKCWKEGVGQLISYNYSDPKSLRLYLFGNYAKHNKALALDTIKSVNIRPYECIQIENGIQIKDLDTNEIVMEWKSPLA